MLYWHALTLGILLSMQANGGGLDFLTPPLPQEPDAFVTYSCVNGGEEIYLPACAETEWGIECSFLAGETISTGVLADDTHTAVAVGMSPKAAGSDHRLWELSVSDEPGDFEVAPECRDRSEPGDLNPRISFQPVYPRGCPQPGGLVWLNLRPIGVGAKYCGETRRCAAVVYGP